MLSSRRSSGLNMSRNYDLSGLGDADRRHFEYGKRCSDDFLSEIRSCLAGYWQKDARRPREVAARLNSLNVKTACGGQWTIHLATELLSLLRTGHVSRSQPIKANAQSTVVEAMPRSSTGRLRPDKRERARVAAAEAQKTLGKCTDTPVIDSPPKRVRVRKRVPKPKLDLDRILERLPKLDAEQLQRQWLNCHDHLLRKAGLPRPSDVRAILAGIHAEWDRRRIIASHLAADEWPTTDITQSQKALSKPDWLEHGMLSFMGYHVGKTAPTPRQLRLIILDSIFLEELPPVLPLLAMKEWGIPKARGRILKLANVLASLTKNAKRNLSVDLSVSISDWEQDLEYLRIKFWLPAFARQPFSEEWPSN
jgi:hypothetical protein